MSEPDEFYDYDAPPVWSEDECLPLDQLHPLVHEAARTHLDAGREAEAVEAAWVALRDLLRSRLKSGSDGAALVDEIGAASAARLNLTPNRTQSQRSQHEGVRHMLRGLVSYVRNPIAHDSSNPFDGDWTAALHVLVVMSLVAEHLEVAGTEADVAEAVELLCQPDVPLDEQAIAAAVTRAGRSQYEPLVEAIVARLAGKSHDGASVDGLLAGYHLVLSRSAAPEVSAAAADGASDLLKHAGTTPLGMRLLRRGVTQGLDPYAYAKVLSLIRSSLDSPGDPGTIPISEAGRLAATLKSEDRELISRDQLAALEKGGTEGAAQAVHFLLVALPEDAGANPTPLQGKFSTAVARRLAEGREPELKDALRAAFPSSSLNFNLAIHNALRELERETPDGGVLSELVGEFGDIRRWRRSSADTSTRSMADGPLTA